MSAPSRETGSLSTKEPGRLLSTSKPKLEAGFSNTSMVWASTVHGRFHDALLSTGEPYCGFCRAGISSYVWELELTSNPTRAHWVPMVPVVTVACVVWLQDAFQLQATSVDIAIRKPFVFDDYAALGTLAARVVFSRQAEPDERRPAPHVSRSIRRTHKGARDSHTTHQFHRARTTTKQ